MAAHVTECHGNYYWCNEVLNLRGGTSEHLPNLRDVTVYGHVHHHMLDECCI